MFSSILQHPRKWWHSPSSRSVGYSSMSKCGILMLTLVKPLVEGRQKRRSWDRRTWAQIKRQQCCKQQLCGYYCNCFHFLGSSQPTWLVGNCFWKVKRKQPKGVGARNDKEEARSLIIVILWYSIKYVVGWVVISDPQNHVADLVF